MVVLDRWLMAMFEKKYRNIFPIKYAEKWKLVRDYKNGERYYER